MVLTYKHQEYGIIARKQKHQASQVQLLRVSLEDVLVLMCIWEREVLPCFSSCLCRAGTMVWTRGLFEWATRRKRRKGGCDLYPLHYFQWQNAAYKLVTAGFLGSAQSPVCVWLADYSVQYLGLGVLTSVHFNGNMQPVCHHSESAVVISLFILFLHTGFMISEPQCKSCSALNKPCGKAMLNI